MVKPLRYSGPRDTLHIEHPNVVALKRIDEPIARQLQALALHHYDLGFSHDALGEIAKLDRSQRRERFLAEALWISSMARYFKCFGGNQSRISLSATKVLKGHEDAKHVFRYFQALRDKHIIHDENPFSQAFAGVALGHRDAKPKVEGVLSMAFNKLTMDDEELRKFSDLLRLTIAWVDARRHELSDTLAQKYEQWTYDDLMALPDIPFTVPSSDQVAVKR
jgi:hypothetical protein